MLKIFSNTERHNSLVSAFTNETMQSSVIEESAMDLSRLHTAASKAYSKAQLKPQQQQQSSVICATPDNAGICDTPSGMDLSLSRRSTSTESTIPTTPKAASATLSSSTNAISPTVNSVPHQSRIEKVLQRYQATAIMTLNGPDWSAYHRSLYPSVDNSRSTPETLDLRVKSVLSSTPTRPSPTPGVSLLKDYDPLLAPPPFPIQQPPLLTPPDQSPCVRSETMLDGELIACFNVGGEKRLCFPQILNIVLRDFTLQQINAIVKELQIYCSTCTTEQMEVLKRNGDIPSTAPSCGLITKTDAHRLCSTLLALNPMHLDFTGVPTVQIYHECFGRCVGRYAPSLYKLAESRCVQCEECLGAFSPSDFVSHSHRHRENRTVHWGFDPNNWRSYLLPVEDCSYDNLSVVNGDQSASATVLPLCTGGRKALKGRLTSELKAAYKSLERVKLIVKEMKSRFNISSSSVVQFGLNENNKRKNVDNVSVSLFYLSFCSLLQ